VNEVHRKRKKTKTVYTSLIQMVVIT